MFDMAAIGKRISGKRKALNMTQMELADRMGVSFQAVSNWERGNSMPDVGKLSDLAALLGLSIDELLGSDTQAAKIVRHAADGTETTFIRTAHVTPEDVADAAPVLRPEQTKRIVDSMREDGGSAAFDWASIASLAPFLDSETLSALARSAVGNDCAIGELASIAPFMDADALAEIAERALERGASVGELAAIAPFLEKKTLDNMARKMLADGCCLGDLTSIAPFIDRATLGEIAENAALEDGSIGELASIAPFVDADALGKIAERMMENGGQIGELCAIAPFLKKEALAKIAVAALQNGQSASALTSILPFLDKNALKELLNLVAEKRP